MKTVTLLIGVATLLAINASAQSPVLAYSTTYISTSTSVNSYTSTPASGSNAFSACSSTIMTYSFNNGTSNALKLLNITVGSNNFYINNNTAATIKLRRVDNAVVSGNRSIVSVEAYGTAARCPSGSTIDLKTSYQDVMENFLNTNYINMGTDNIFTNASNGDGNNNNIERVDVLFYNGFQAFDNTAVGFAMFDRGNNNGHDPFRIAAITSLDGNGDPASFGPIKTCIGGNGSNNGSWGHPSTANGNLTLNEYVMRKDPTSDTYLKVSAALSQQVGGVFFSLADLGIPNNQLIYGYALFATDGIANPTSAQLLNINDATVYPTNTTETNGGLDLMAITATFSISTTVLAVNETLLGSIANNKAILSWSMQNLPVASVVQLERSGNGIDYSADYIIPSNQIQNGKFEEMFNGPASYYRLKIKPSTGQTYYSNVVFLRSQNEKQVAIYPNIISRGQTFTVKGLKEGMYKIIFIATDGKQFSDDLSVNNGSASLNRKLNDLSKGFYYVKLFDRDRTFCGSGKIIIQ